MKLSETIAIRVGKLLNERNLSQYSLFKNGGVPRSTVCDVINNKKQAKLLAIFWCKTNKDSSICESIFVGARVLALGGSDDY